MIGSLLCDSDADPRMRRRAPSPVEPEVGSATTPGSRPAIIWLKSAIGLFSSSLASTVAIVLPSFFFCVATPAPVTTIWSRAMAVCSIAKFATTDSPAATVTVCEPDLYPTSSATTVTSPAGTLSMRKRPAAFVRAPIPLPPM